MTKIHQRENSSYHIVLSSPATFRRTERRVDAGTDTSPRTQFEEITIDIKVMVESCNFTDDDRYIMVIQFIE